MLCISNMPQRASRIEIRLQLRDPKSLTDVIPGNGIISTCNCRAYESCEEALRTPGTSSSKLCLPPTSVWLILVLGCPTLLRAAGTLPGGTVPG